jgi:hypothetical protein
MYYADEAIEALCKRADALKTKRSTFENQWVEVAERVLPGYARTFNGGLSTVKNSGGGEKNTEMMFDATAALGLTKFAAAMESMLTPRNQKWHRLRASNRYLMKDHSVRSWFDDATDILFHYRQQAKANFQSQLHEIYVNLGAFGTGVLFTDALDEGGLRYKQIHLSEVVFDVNHQGVVDTVFRWFEMTARQILQKWPKPEQPLPDELAQAQRDNPDKLFKVLHMVMPRADFDPSRADAKGKRFASVYVLYAKDKTKLSEGGYTTFPYAISRYVAGPGELFGRSPAMLVLPNIKVLNDQTKTLLKQGHRTVDPVLLVHDDGIIDSFSLKPGALNAGGVSAEGRSLVQALPVGNIAIGKDMMDDNRAAINDAFLVTLFQILVETPQMTATEVIERVREKGALLSPTMGRQQTELLDPMIERELDLLAAQGLLPPLPEALLEAEGEYKVEYDSPLSRAQRAEEAAGGLRMIDYAANIAANTQDPSILDHFNFDVMVPELADIQGLPARWMTTPDQLEQKRSGRQQSQEQQALIQALPGAAAMAKATVQPKQ